jgi:hypothetical protein
MDKNAAVYSSGILFSDKKTIGRLHYRLLQPRMLVEMPSPYHCYGAGWVDEERYGKSLLAILV